MKKLSFKFQQNRTLNEKFDFFEGKREAGTLIFKFQSQLLLINMKMFCFKFQQNRTINEEFDFLRGRGGDGKGTPFINYNLNYYW